MFIFVKPKKINNVNEFKIHAVFEHQGVKFEERYKTKKIFLASLKRTKHKFINAVDFNQMICIYPNNLKEYENGH